MNCIIPFEKTLEFDRPISEICSISLEHDITKNDSELLGNFYLSGTCKEHELSINTTDYNFTIPFSVELTNRVNPDSLEFEINDFTYELDGNKMVINIEYSVNGEDIVEKMDDNPHEDIREIQINNIEQDDEIIINETESLFDTLDTEEDYTVYKIHQVKHEETIESIAKLYNITNEDILKLNSNSNLSENERLIIPINHE